jgi:NhaP-type Na+/H+ or K+/H+ antiporter
MATAIFGVGLMLFCAYLFKAIFDRTGIPDVLLLVIVGLVVGPLLGWVKPEDFGVAGRVVATMALVLILFQSGTELEIPTLRRAMGATLLISLTTFAATAVIVAAGAHYLAGLSWAGAALLGLICAGTSSAVVIPLVQNLAMGDDTRTVLILESALTDVLCIVGLVAMITAIKSGAAHPAEIAGHVSLAFVGAAAIGIVAAFGWLLLLRLTRRMPHGSVSTIAACLVLYGVSELAEFSGAIAVMAFGLVLANGREFAKAQDLIRPGRFATLSDEEYELFSRWVFLLKTFFFIYLGISMRLGNTEVLLIGSGIVLAIYALRHVLAALCLPATTTRADGAIVAIMVPKGLAAAVLAGIPLQEGIEGGAAIQDLAFVIVLASITLTAVLLPLVTHSPLRSAYGRMLSRLNPDAPLAAPPER